MNAEYHKKQLVKILQAAYSGEKAAAYAYRGHWKSSKSLHEREKIAHIEQEEWDHRAFILEILKKLNAKPLWWKEILMGFIGRFLGLLCYISGWFFPMFFAGRLETQNVDEYKNAAYHAAAINLEEFKNKLIHMRDVEKEHEIYFNNAIVKHPLTPYMKKIFKTK